MKTKYCHILCENSLIYNNRKITRNIYELLKRKLNVTAFKVNFKTSLTIHFQIINLFNI